MIDYIQLSQSMWFMWLSQMDDAWMMTYAAWGLL